MIQLISSLISDVKSPYLQYVGDSKSLKRTVDSTEAARWFSIANDLCKLDSVEINLFWKRMIKKLLVLNKDTEYSDCSEEFLSMIRTYSKASLFWDEFLQFIHELMRTHIPVKIKTDRWDDFCLFRRLKEDEVATVGITTVSLDWAEDLKVDNTVAFYQLSPEELRYNRVVLLIREVKEWFWSFREHSVVHQMNDKRYVPQKYIIWQDVTIRLRGTDVLSVDQIETQYRTEKEEWVWYVTDKEGKKICNTDDFVPYQVTNEGDVQVIKLFGAYTQVLRSVLGFNPQTWQYKYLIGHKRLNYVAGTRRAGKTMLSSYLIIRRLYKNPTTRKNSYRQTKWTYIAPSEDKFKSVIDFIEASSEKIKMLKVLKYVAKQNRLILVDEHLARWNQKQTIVVGTYDFVSAKWFEPARGNGSDEIVIDEAGFVSEDVYLNIIPIIENEKSTLFCISTIDWETPKQWFYEGLVDAEEWTDPDAFAMRVTIDDIDNNIISEDSKERIKDKLSKNMQRYYAELYATFPSINSVFSTTNFYTIEKVTQSFQEVIIWYDPAKRSDYAGIVVAGIYKAPDWVMKCTLLEEFQIQWDYSTHQKDFLLNLRRRYATQAKRVQMIMDVTVVWDVVAEIMGDMVDYKVWYNGKSNKPEMSKFGEWKYSKRLLVLMMQSQIDSGNFRAYTSLTALMQEIKHFKQIVLASWQMAYAADVGHDDLVNAAMLVSFYFGFIIWQMYTLRYDSDRELKEMRDWLRKNWNLLESQQRRLLNPITQKKRAGYTF